MLFSSVCCSCFVFLGGNQDGKFSVGFRDGVVRTVVGLDRESQAAYVLVVEAIGVSLIQMALYLINDGNRLDCHMVFVLLTIELVFSLVLFCHLQSRSSHLIHDNDEKKSIACTCAMISDYCSVVFVPVSKDRTKTVRFSCFGNH